MNLKIVLVPLLLLATGVVRSDDAPQAKAAGQATEAPGKAKEDPNLGMSILGNQEAPKALVIVPWKTSELGDALGIAPMLDDARGPVDRDVFLRALSYYAIRSETTRHAGATPRGSKTAAAESDAAQVTPAPRRSKS